MVLYCTEMERRLKLQSPGRRAGIGCIVLVWLTGVFTAVPLAAPPSADDRPKIVAFGDSLTAGLGVAADEEVVGGAVGVAVVGSVFASIYGSKVGDFLAGSGAPGDAIRAARHSIVAALRVAGRLGDPELANAAKSAFVEGFHAGLYVGAGVLLVAVVAVLLWLPAHARAEDVERQHAEWEAARPVSQAGSPTRS